MWMLMSVIEWYWIGIHLPRLFYIYRRFQFKFQTDIARFDMNCFELMRVPCVRDPLSLLILSIQISEINGHVNSMRTTPLFRNYDDDLWLHHQFKLCFDQMFNDDGVFISPRMFLLCWILDSALDWQHK